MRVVITLLALAAGITTANLLANSDFEAWANDTTPQLWRVEGRTATSVRWEPDTVHSGNAAARLTRLVSGPGNNKGLFQRVLVTAGQSYHYSVWCWDNSDQIALGLVVTWRAADSGYIGSEPVRYSVDESNWQLVADSATAPAGTVFADFIIRTYDQNNAPAGNRVLVDDAWLDRNGAQPDTVSVWFTPDSLGQRLGDFFDRATRSIDYCCYNSSRIDVTLALIAAHNRGVRVRVITDNTRLDDPWVQFLRGSGVVVWSDSASSNSSLYMHNKFAIRDLADTDSTNDWVWTGSYNPNAEETNADCAIEIPSTELAQAYYAEFRQMWGGDSPFPNPESSFFHNSKQDRLTSHRLLVNGQPAYLYFAPQDRVVDTIAAVVGRAQQLVMFAINSFTYDALADSMRSRWNAGVTVAGTIDKAGANEPGSEYPRLRQWHIPLLIDSVPYGTGMLHEKIMVIDSGVTVTGSTNWSANANYSNDENTLILTDPEIAHRFLQEIVLRYLEAGGTYPPGVTETKPTGHPGPMRPSWRSPVRSLPLIRPGVRVYDALGRRHSAQESLTPGVYLIMSEGSTVTTTVLVR